MKRARIKPEIKRQQSFTLNITSMTDMFTILLVFLLQTFAAADVQIESIEGLRLPNSNSEKNPVIGLKIAVTQNELIIDSVQIAKIENNDFNKSVLDPNDNQFIKPLFLALKKINEDPTNKDKIGKILLQADQETPYSTLRKIMYTASMAGFPNLKLVTVIGN